ncbi:hypothetical protein V8E53_001391 [Lactarius tabidus]
MPPMTPPSIPPRFERLCEIGVEDEPEPDTVGEEVEDEPYPDPAGEKVGDELYPDAVGEKVDNEPDPDAVEEKVDDESDPDAAGEKMGDEPYSDAVGERVVCETSDITTVGVPVTSGLSERYKKMCVCGQNQSVSHHLRLPPP